jgi:cytochrome oxidase Cu insertion factor (SCO1/SenC/PrrC family)
MRPAGPNPRMAALLGLGALVALALALSACGGGRAGQGAAAWQPPGSLGRLMNLFGTPARPAPSFALTDQHGRSVSLASLRGRVIVLEPMDPKCTSLCPIVSQDFVDAAHALGHASSRVVFLGINVNQYHARVADVLAFSRLHRLEPLPNWHFLTGSTRQLRRVWRSYGIAVKPSRSGDVAHSALMEFIDPKGRERWIASPDYNRAAIPQWGAGIATVAGHLAG